MSQFTDLVKEAQRSGWITTDIPIDHLRAQAQRDMCAEVPARRGEPTASKLRPATRETAHPQSLSAIVGLGQQPLHTDGAHHPTPPDIVILASAEPNATATLLLRAPARWTNPPGITADALTHGMFMVHAGADSFFTPVLSSSGWRYDAGCMTACDARASQVAQYVEAAAERADRHSWSVPGQVLVIDNRKVLHARAAVESGDVDARELDRLMLLLPSTS